MEEENPEEYKDPETALGEKKKLSPQMAKTYNPNVVESTYVRIDKFLLQMIMLYMFSLTNPSDLRV